jgi:hypothetical protein
MCTNTYKIFLVAAVVNAAAAGGGLMHWQQSGGGALAPEKSTAPECDVAKT